MHPRFPRQGLWLGVLSRAAFRVDALLFVYAVVSIFCKKVVRQKGTANVY